MGRVLNFYPGPSALPVEALEEAKAELLDWKGTGMSVMEISHRSKEFDAVHNETIDLLKKLFGIPKNFSVLLLQGGATLQFAMVPMNLIGAGETASYAVTGTFSNNSFKTAKKIADVALAVSVEEAGKYFRIPKQEEINIADKSAYLHLTSNNTIFGTQWKKFPETGKVPVVADMSSDILSRRIEWEKLGLIYAGAQKNLGPSGVTVVIIRDDLIEKSGVALPDILSYKVLVGKNSLYNTPCTFGIYMMNKVLKWVEKVGGLKAVEDENEKKAKLLYGVIDANPEFYVSQVEKESRSSMNVIFNLKDENIDAQFIADAKNEGIVGVKGHRSAGGIRVSIYNSHKVKDVEIVANFMKEFVKKNG
ncbi:MAG TPA: 3-phosphoserine/phosphohydroxythreonine transaminase [Spirochaetota bacterium]|nr:3-phosphoserine/phosphohydroxythreonine transaminase [Spirochaetota bacterium]